MAQAKLGDILRVDSYAAEQNGVDIERGPFEGRVVACLGRQVVVEFRYPGVRDAERVTLDLHRRLDLTNNARLAGVTVLKRRKS